MDLIVILIYNANISAREIYNYLWDALHRTNSSFVEGDLS